MRHIIKVFFSCSCLLFVFLIIFPSHIFSADKIYIDNFDTVDESKWTVYQNYGSVSIIDGSIKLSTPSGNFFPYLVSKPDIFPLLEYKLLTKFKIEGPLNFGSGIILSDKIFPNLDKRDILPSDIIFLIWPESNTTANLWTSLCPTTEPGCNQNQFRKISTFNLNIYHDFKVNYKNGLYDVSIDSNSIKSYIASRNLKYALFGSPQETITVTSRASILVDFLSITSPAPEKEKVVILPGFGGSY